MPIQHAINFIKEAGKNHSFRKSLYPLNRDEILPYLGENGYKFTIHEFEESINLLHVKCQTREEADDLFEVVWWFKMMYPY